MSTDPDTQARSNDALRGFARAIIRDRPGPLRASWSGTTSCATSRPARASRGNSDLAVALPQFGRIVRRNEIARDRWFPGFVPHVQPAGQAGARLPRARARPAAVDGGAGDRGAARAGGRGGRAARCAAPPPPRRREVFLLAGAALAMLLGTAATSEFVLRYLIPVVPLLVCGGVAAAADLAALAARSCPCRCAAGPRTAQPRRARSRPQRGSKNSTTPTTTIAVEIAISVGERSPDEQDQDAGHEQREPGAHRKPGRLRAGLLREAVAAAPAARGTVPDSGSRSADRSSSCVPPCRGFCQPGAEPCL